MFSLDALSAQAVLGPLIGGIFGWLVALRMSRSNEAIATAARVENEKLTLAARVEGDKLRQATADATFVDGLTRRFKLLMDGYEAHIKDLSEEVSQLRSEIKHLHSLLTDRVSQVCPAAHECAYLKAAIQSVGDRDATT